MRNTPEGNVIKLRKYLSFRQRRNRNKLAQHYEIPRTSEGQKNDI
jgi:hypothetical protein